MGENKASYLIKGNPRPCRCAQYSNRCEQIKSPKYPPLIKKTSKSSRRVWEMLLVAPWITGLERREETLEISWQAHSREDEYGMVWNTNIMRTTMLVYSYYNYEKEPVLPETKTTTRGICETVLGAFYVWKIWNGETRASKWVVTLVGWKINGMKYRHSRHFCTAILLYCFAAVVFRKRFCDLLSKRKQIRTSLSGEFQCL